MFHIELEMVFGFWLATGNHLPSEVDV